MAVKTENNKLRAYFHAHMVPTLTKHNHGEFRLDKIPVGMNDRRMNELMSMLNEHFGAYSRSNGKRGSIVAIKDTKRGIIVVNLNGEIKAARARKDRGYSRLAVAH